MSTLTIPPQPAFGEPIPLNGPNPEVLAFLARRKSASALTLRAPGPSPSELHDLIRLAARAPDHGKLFPWRFLVIEGEAKARLAARLEALAEKTANPTKAQAVLGKLKAPPASVVVISRVDAAAAIPDWEQELSAGAVCTLFLLAAQAMGYGANWITDWYSYEPEAVALLGLQGGERVAGFIHIGTPSEPPAERVRPVVEAIVSHL